MSVLNWRTDPIYFDPEPLPVNEWVNANELIEAGKTVLIIQDPNLQLNLFPILVRRADFVRTKPSDRILARFPFVNITKEEEDLILAKQLLIAEKLRDYFYQSDNRSILEWRDVLRKHLERGFVPLPFIRCFSEFVTINLLVNREFQSARGESFIMPSSLTEELAYLCGMVNGDGNLQKYTLSIVDFSEANIQQLKEQFHRLFSQEGRVQFKTPNSPELIVNNLWVVRLFSFFTNQPIDSRKYDALREPMLFCEEPFRSHYWSGVMDADGTYANKNVVLTSASKRFSHDFYDFLEAYDIKPTYNEGNDGVYKIYVPRKFHTLFTSIMKCNHPEKALEFQKLTQKGPRGYKAFLNFKKETLLNNHFDFSLLPQLSVIGIRKKLIQLRGKTTINHIAKQLRISPKILYDIESGKQNITISVLRQFLLLHNEKLMPYLSKSENIRFRTRRSLPVKLDIQPNQKLHEIASKFLFYKNSMKLKENSYEIKSEIQSYFDLQMNEDRINNSTILRYFNTFCNLS